jgi:hypothetical protein
MRRERSTRRACFTQGLYGTCHLLGHAGSSSHTETSNYAGPIPSGGENIHRMWQRDPSRVHAHDTGLSPDPVHIDAGYDLCMTLRGWTTLDV